MPTATKQPLPNNKIALDKSIFEVFPKSHDLLHSAYVNYLANSRQNNAVTKKRGEVSGGGRKPWRQKGTGRARTGSIRNPIRKGGGVIFGPTGQENYKQKLPKKMIKLAIRQALSIANKEGIINIVDKFTIST